MVRVLIVGDLNGYALSAAKIAFEQGAHTKHVMSVLESLNVLRSGGGVDLILADIESNFSTLIKHIKQERFCIPIIACGVNVEPEEAGNSIKLGAKDYLPLPPNTEIIAEIIKTISKNDLQFIYKDKKILDLIDIIDTVSPSDASILITGESGTGKEMVARMIHAKSNRAKNSFIAINCAAIPENLLESELFGHEKGSFTGAVAKRIGKFEEANGGTLLLDEISEMHIRLQAKLLRAIQEKVIDRVGGVNPVPINIRIIATSNRLLEYEIKKGNFREDLYFRLNVINVHVPPIRDRIDDIVPLSEYFIEKFSKLNKCHVKNLSKEAIQRIKSYLWPGNVREIENRMHRAVLLSKNNEIEISDIFDNCDIAKNENFVVKTLQEVERELITKTLNHFMGSKSQTANVLGISIRTLRNKLKEYDTKSTVNSK